MAEDPVKLVVCARADAIRKAPGSAFNRTCSECETRVMIAPTGQNFVKANPDAKIICMGCFFARHAEQVTEIGLTGTPEEIAQEVAEALENDWPRRN